MAGALQHQTNKKKKSMLPCWGLTFYDLARTIDKVQITYSGVLQPLELPCEQEASSSEQQNLLRRYSHEACRSFLLSTYFELYEMC